jgi:1-acylglycerone phosphate reductase
MRALYELNVFSPIRTIQLFLPLLMASTNSPVIINNTSGAGLTPVGCAPWQAAYNSSKAAYSSVVESMRHELAMFDIKVVELRTGSVKTNFFLNQDSGGEGPKLVQGSLYEAAREDIEKMMRGEVMEKSPAAEVYAKNVVGDLERGIETIYRGRLASVAKWAFGLQALIPRFLIDRIVRGMGAVDHVERKVRAATSSKAS